MHFSLRFKNLIAFFILSSASIIVYSNTFYSPFHLDDFHSIVENLRLRDLSNFKNISNTRYIGELSFALNYYVGGLNVFGYHVVNVIIHILNSFLLFSLVLVIWEIGGRETPGRSSTGSPAIYFMALGAALIFSVHPIETQAVTYIVQRYASLATMFYLLSVYCYLRFRLSATFYMRPLYYTLSLFIAVLAMKTKEISFTLPFTISLAEFIFFRGSGFDAFRSTGKRIRYLLPLFLTLFIIPLSLIKIDKPLGEIIGDVGEISAETRLISRTDYLLTQSRVIVTYIRLMLFPIRQNLDYDYPVYHSPFEPPVLFSSFFLMLIVILGIYLFIRSRRGNNVYAAIAGFGISWFFVTLSVESSIIPIRDVIFEHRLYLPGTGFILAAVVGLYYGIDAAYSKIGQPKFNPLIIFCAVIFIITVLFSVATYARNSVWKDDVSLWKDVVEKSPEKARGHLNLGVAYAKKGLYKKGERELLQALKLDNPPLLDVHLNLAGLYYKTGRSDQALKEYRIASIIQSDDPRAYYGLGVIYQEKGETGSAMMEYQKVIELKPGDYRTYHNMGLLYQNKGDLEEATRYYRKALSMNPGYAKSAFNLAGIYEISGRVDMAIKEYLNVIRNDPRYAYAYQRLGDLYKKTGDIQRAENFYREAAEAGNFRQTTDERY